MIRTILVVSYFLVSVGAIVTFVNSGDQSAMPNVLTERPVISIIGLLLMVMSVVAVDFIYPQKKVSTFSSVYFGLLTGFLLSYILMLALRPALENSDWQGIVTIMVTLMLSYMSISLLLQTRDDFRFIVPYVEFSRELKGSKPLIIDSSALIDGRISDVLETKIIDAQLVVPDFILHEIQSIADSSDKGRRTRGRRGLEILTKLQKDSEVDLRMMETDKRTYDGVPVDQKLVLLGKDLGGRIVTNDYNLNKVAGVQGVQTINLNDVANALKPRFLPGEHIRIKVIKDGESPGQGVGYLDDGTMVVCENCSDKKGREVEIAVTSVLQSSAGRMIFGKPYDDREGSEPIPPA
ncbi:putative PIN and TRAM-domain containing protein precursor [Polystyrenella longa]|uniref:Putative PIN and TRAM-domain containing protein n=1 Tax=Polystyrenella longa TaxID=2528007 RepID=A0A518CQG4_9PLAN|nr:TRAM domain-containing protein [Polystyrenella longa]QDU81453.1 putative PIN and TRAM-domain containing protein precursor [Polystyrenella longa]